MLFFDSHFCVIPPQVVQMFRVSRLRIRSSSALSDLALPIAREFHLEDAFREYAGTRYVVE